MRLQIGRSIQYAQGVSVMRKYLKDKHALVDIEISGENQRQAQNTRGMATVILPSREVSLPVFLNGAGLELELPVIR